MTTFQLIINAIFKIEKNNFFSNIEGIDSNIRCFFSFDRSIKDTDMPLYKSKFELFKKGLVYFTIKGCKEEEFISYFNKIQRVYHVLNRFVYKYKLQKSPIVVDTDMILNELQETDKNVICIYQQNSRYLFRIYDLIKIINMSLTNPQGFFSNPLCIKNPYNNLPFGKNILYYIYFFIIDKPSIVANVQYTELFFKLHSCNFSLTTFLSKYEYLLRERIIENYINNSTHDKLYSDIMTMIKIFNSKNMKNRITIDSNFPKNKIMEVFKPYLLLYMYGNLLLIPSQKYKASCDFDKKLKKFQQFNPLFGRAKVTMKTRICKDGKVIKIKDKVIFNDKYINFNEYDNDVFLKDHLSYKYLHYSNHMIEDDDANEDFVYEDDDDTDEENNNIIFNAGHLMYDDDEDEDEDEDEDDTMDVEYDMDSVS